MKTLVYSFCITLLSFHSFGQLFGTKTIGGTNPTFSNIAQALSSLSVVGISGPVILNIRDGTYNEQIYINNIPGASSTNTVTFQSESLDSSAVIIYTNLATIKTVYSFEKIILKNLTINGIGSAVVDLSHVGCRVTNCVINGPQYSIRLSRDRITIKNNDITGTLQTSSNGQQILNNLIHGEVHLSSNRSQFTGNQVDGRLQVSFSKDLTVKNNLFHDDFHFSYSSRSHIFNNIIDKELSHHYSDNCLYKANKIYGNCDFDFGDYDTVANNFIYGYCHTFQSHHCAIIFNNFSLDTGNYFYDLSFNTVIENNIMPPIFYSDLNNSTINHNNYPAGGGIYDSNPYFISPDYVSNSDLHATNMALYGKGSYIPSVPEDIDSISRSNPPTVGANEICIDSDTLLWACGDSLPLSLCNIPATGNFLWIPSTGLNDFHLRVPKLLVSISGWYVVQDSISGFTDSIYIDKKDLDLIESQTIDSIRCGETATLYATYNSGATYLWTPPDSLSSTNAQYTFSSPAITTTYTITATVPGCGTYVDSITLYVNSLPTAYCYLNTQIHNYISFLNASVCADTYQWDFGDSTQSTSTNPAHIYSSTGQFLVTLIACNSYGCDTFQGYVYVDTLVFAAIEENNLSSFFDIYPNPANDYFTIYINSDSKDLNLKIYNLMGQTIYKDKIPGKSLKKININNLSPGLYLLNVYDTKRRYSKKIEVRR